MKYADSSLLDITWTFTYLVFGWDYTGLHLKIIIKSLPLSSYLIIVLLPSIKDGRCISVLHMGCIVLFPHLPAVVSSACDFP